MRRARLHHDKALVRDDAAPLVLVSACLFPLGMGIGVLFPLVTVMAQASVPMPLLGIATASPVMFRSLAGAVGVSVLGALFAAGLTSRSTGLFATGGHFGPALSLVLFAAAALTLLSSVARGCSGAVRPLPCQTRHRQLAARRWRSDVDERRLGSAQLPLMARDRRSVLTTCGPINLQQSSVAPHCAPHEQQARTTWLTFDRCARSA
jgi:hypothetical protein